MRAAVQRREWITRWETAKGAANTGAHHAEGVVCHALGARKAVADPAGAGGELWGGTKGEGGVIKQRKGVLRAARRRNSTGVRRVVAP